MDPSSSSVSLARAPSLLCHSSAVAQCGQLVVQTARRAPPLRSRSVAAQGVDYALPFLRRFLISVPPPCLDPQSHKPVHPAIARLQVVAHTDRAVVGPDSATGAISTISGGSSDQPVRIGAWSCGDATDPLHDPCPCARAQLTDSPSTKDQDYETIRGVNRHTSQCCWNVIGDSRRAATPIPQPSRL